MSVQDLSELFEKVATLNVQVGELTRNLDRKSDEDAEWRKHIYERHDRFETKIDAIHSRMDKFGEVATTAKTAKLDIETHVADHRWWFGALGTLWAIVAGIVAFVATHWPRFREWVNSVGRVNNP